MTTATQNHQSSQPAGELPKTYAPAEHEDRIRARWDAARAFAADPQAVLSGSKPPYCIVIPPPNVTAALHLGHALNNSIQDILIRAHRMMGYETLWMPGTDHAGIATQAVVEKRLLAEEGKRRTDFDRDEFIARVQAWKDEYEATIVDQLKRMGASCDWDRQRFTMDEVCAKAVREAFFRLFKDGLIYRGKRLVNWDPVLQTAVADDETLDIEIDSHFWYLEYPVCDAEGNETGDKVTVATTRPETYFGDTAVAVNPTDPDRAKFIGQFAKLPFVGRIIPIIGDDYVVKPDPESSDNKARYASGFLKVTPAHDTNDWDIGQRHDLPIINVMAPDASISNAHGWDDVGEATWALGLPGKDARKEVEKRFKVAGLLSDKKPYKHSVSHSDRSKAPIEPYLSDQWYVKVTDDRMRGAALRSMSQREGVTKQSEGDAGLTFHPDRYAKTFETWHENLRDWCISRQLWWGHRIPVWSWFVHDEHGGRSNDFDVETGPSDKLRATADLFSQIAEAVGMADDIAVGFNGNAVQSWLTICARSTEAESIIHAVNGYCQGNSDLHSPFDTPATKAAINALSETYDGSPLRQDEDVLDTWFSSALWPMSTMGWPEAGADTEGLLEAFNPTSVLTTAREIITLWVSRMVMFQRYFMGGPDNDGQLPFADVFIHAMIQDGDGRKMSKSLGNGVDPLDIIHSHGADAMRFTLCQMTTQTQDVRMPVALDKATGKNTSPKFDIGRNFGNKLWNASRFAMGILTGPASDGGDDELTLADKWMLSRLASAEADAREALGNYQFNAYADRMYDLLWRDFCDWYLEAIKPTVARNPAQRACLRHVLDAVMRLLHPIMPFVTEAIYEQLRTIDAPAIDGLALAEPTKDNLLCTAGWPDLEGIRQRHAEDAAAAVTFGRVQELVGAIREVRAQHKVQPRRKITLHAAGRPLELCKYAEGLIQTLAGVETITDGSADNAVAFRFEDHDLFLSDLADAVDAGAERERLTKLVAELSKSVKALDGRLSNPGYTEKAPAKLVQQTRDEMETVKADLAHAQSQLDALA